MNLFAGIDPLCRFDIQKIIEKIKSQGNRYLISDHMCGKLFPVVTGAYIVNEGAILVEGAPDKIAQSELARKILFWRNF